VEAFVDGWPVWVVFVVLWAGAFTRGTATYWVGRGVRAGGSRSRWARHLDSRVVTRAEGWVRRFGAPAVTLGFLTVGVQTAINASAGMLRMPQRRFLPAVTVGAALWSLLYTTVGFTVVDAWLGNVSWWWAVAAVAVVVAIFVLSGRLEESAKAEDPARLPDAGGPAADDPAAPA
jgi:membrane protein DedA with SNARE-associated domain